MISLAKMMMGKEREKRVKSFRRWEGKNERERWEFFLAAQAGEEREEREK